MYIQLVLSLDASKLKKKKTPNNRQALSIPISYCIDIFY